MKDEESEQVDIINSSSRTWIVIDVARDKLIRKPHRILRGKKSTRENQAANLSPGEEDLRKESHVQKKRDIETVFESLRCMGRQRQARQCLPHT